MIDTENKLYIESTPTYPLSATEGVLDKLSPISLDIDDDKLAKIIDDRLKAADKFFNGKAYNLKERRKKNELYLFGKQIEEKEKKNELKIYESRYLDNALYEIEASLKPLGMSRLPDMIVTPGTDNPDSRKNAENVSKIIDTDIKKRENRIALGIAFKHLPVYFIGVIKCRWNADINDFVFEVVHPEYIEVDHTCQSNNADEMMIIAQTLPITVSEVLIQFPKNKEKFIEELQGDGIIPKREGDPTESDLATQIKIKEVWFVHYVSKGDTTDEQKYERVNGVVWKYKKVILDKMKNPNFDYEGEEKIYTYKNPNDETTKMEVGPNMVMANLTAGMPIPNVKKETVFRNYFDHPRMPYFFMGYDQWHKTAYDETSRLEQNLRNQEALDKVGKKVVEKIKGRIKHIFSKDGGLQQKDVEMMDLDDDKQDLLVTGDVNKVHSNIVPEQPTAQEFKFLDEVRQRMYSLSGASAIRGQLQSDVATTNQIAREADYTRADDLVEDTINAACEWIADWSLQMMKLRYTDYHFRKLLGQKGVATFLKIKGDMIEDGMEVMIKSSGTDKLKIKNQAMDMAKLQMIDPLNFYRDLGVSDPEGRTKDLLTFQTNPAAYLASLAGLGSNTQELVGNLSGISNITTPPSNGILPNPALQPPAPPTPPGGMMPGGNPTPQNTQLTPKVATPPTPSKL